MFAPTLCVFLLVSASVVAASTVDSCQTTCYIDREPKCAARLEQSNVVESSGIYQINESLMELKCNFSSHNNNVKVSWHYRQMHGDSWQHVRCSQTEQKNNCDMDRDPSFSSLSLCRVKMTALSQEGFYKCRGEMSDGVSRRVERFESEEGQIRIFGIESTDTEGTKVLRHAQPGVIQLKVCANPQPEIIWISGDNALHSGESRGRLSASSVHHWYKSRRHGPNEPTRRHSYCYVARLLISAAEKADERIRAVVRADGETRTVDFDIRVTGLLTSKNCGQNAVMAIVFAFISLLHLF